MKKDKEIKQENVYKQIRSIKEGHRFPCPILSYNKATHSFLQEGRHRAMACKQCDIKKIPVWIITSNSNINNDMEDIPLLDNNSQFLSRLSNTWLSVDDIKSVEQNNLYNWYSIDSDSLDNKFSDKSNNISKQAVNLLNIIKDTQTTYRS